jgi:hypothetical protein
VGNAGEELGRGKGLGVRIKGEELKCNRDVEIGSWDQRGIKVQ